MYTRSYLTVLKDEISRSLKDRRNTRDAIEASLGGTAQSPRSKRGSGSGAQPDKPEPAWLKLKLAKRPKRRSRSPDKRPPSGGMSDLEKAFAARAARMNKENGSSK